MRLRSLIATILLAVSVCAGAQQTRAIPQHPSTPAPSSTGNYYALVIGIDTYPASMPQLKTAKSDATAMAQVLEQKYGFHVQRLLDDQATRKGIVAAILAYRNVLTSADNLLIYYAGHGALDEGVAYWLPSGSEASDPSNWVSADDVNHGIRALSAAHVLVVSDSCFSGGLAQPGQRFVAPAKPTVEQTAYLEKMGQRRSRTLMASGGNEPVADSGAEGHSVFAYPLIEGLEHPDQLTFTAQHLFEQSIRIRVGGNARQTPLYTPLANSGHDGGDFIFVRTNLSAAELAAASKAKGSAPTSLTPAQVKANEDYDRGVIMYQANRPADATPILRSACDGGSGRACALLGDMAADGDGHRKDPEAASSLYLKGCDAGEAVACIKLAEMPLDGPGLTRDASRIFELFVKACDQGSATGCTTLGMLYSQGKGTRKNDDESVARFRQGCDGGDLRGCSSLASMYESGIGVATDVVQALSLNSKACAGSESNGCFGLGRFYEGGIGVTKNEQRAASLFNRACSDGVGQACFSLGAMYQAGRSVPKDTIRAKGLYERACSEGDQRGCVKSKLCDAENLLDCVGLGDIYQRGEGVERDYVRASAFYRKACDGGAGGCVELGMMYENGVGMPKDPEQAMSHYKKGCESAERIEPIGCRYLGFAYLHGAGVTADREKADKAFRRGCDAEDPQSCDALWRPPLPPVPPR